MPFVGRWPVESQVGQSSFDENEYRVVVAYLDVCEPVAGYSVDIEAEVAVGIVTHSDTAYVQCLVVWVEDLERIGGSGLCGE